MNAPISATLLIERDDEEIELSITGHYYPGSRGFKAHWSDRFCEPDDEPEMEVVSAKDAAGNEADLTEDELDRAREALLKAMTDRAADYAELRAESRRYTED